MHYRINIGQDGVTRLDNATVQDLDGLLKMITLFAQYDDVVQVEIIEEITVLDGFGPQLARVGSFAAYYNGSKDLIALMELFHCAGKRGYELHEELCRLHKEQSRKRNTIHALLGGSKTALRASIQSTAEQRGCSVEEEMDRLINQLQQTA